MTPYTSIDYLNDWVILSNLVVLGTTIQQYWEIGTAKKETSFAGVASDWLLVL